MLRLAISIENNDFVTKCSLIFKANFLIQISRNIQESCFKNVGFFAAILGELNLPSNMKITCRRDIFEYTYKKVAMVNKTGHAQY